MRHMIILSLLLGLPLVATAQDEPQTAQPQDMQQPPQDAMTQQPQAQQASAEAEIARSQFTREVQDREPVDQVDQEFQAQQEPLYFFTEVKNAAGQTITHRWTHDGEVMAEVPLEIGSDSWRTWSSKEFVPGWDGEWTVEVVDAQGNTLAEESITVETQQMQNVGYSPDEQGQQDQQQQQDQQSGMESGTIDYETQQSQDDMQQQDSETIDYEQQTEDTPPVDMESDENRIDYVPPVEEPQTQDGMEAQDDLQSQDEQETSGEDY